MKKALATLAIAILGTIGAHAQISFTGTYSQDFNSMGSSGTAAPAGWTVDLTANPAAAGTATDAPVNTGAVSASSTVLVDNGASNAGGNKNYGTTGDADRGLGSLGSGGNQRDTYVSFINNTGSTLTSFSISYDGEQWRLGQSAAATNVLTLQYSIDGTSGSWVDLPSSFSFSSPIIAGTAGPLDGNAAANRVAGIGGLYTPAAGIANGASFFLRWADPDDGGSDAAMTIDNFSITAGIPEPATTFLIGFGLLLGAQRLRRKTS